MVDAGQLTLNGDISPDTTARVLILSGAGPGIITGAVTNRDANIPAVEKRGDGTWTLNAVNTYSGRTTVRGGTLALGPSASIAASTPIEVQTNATLNVAAVTGGFVLQSGQTLMGEGTVVGNVTANGTVSPGASIGKLTFANNLVLAGTTLMEIDRTNLPNADLLVSASTTFGGALVVTNIGEELQLGTPSTCSTAHSRAPSPKLCSRLCRQDGAGMSPSSMWTARSRSSWESRLIQPR